MRTKRVGIIIAVLLAVAPLIAFSGSTVVLDTTTYPSAQTFSTPIALPEVGAYNFDLVVTASGTPAFTSASVYLQQEGISRGANYTIANGTFTTCTGQCAQFVVPDVYLGGRIRACWTVVGSSVSLKVTARKVSP